MNLPSKGISVVIEKDFKGLACKCGNLNENMITTQEEVISKGKDAAGKWFEKKRKFLKCLSCGEVQILDEEFSKKLSELEEAKKEPIIEIIHSEDADKLVVTEQDSEEIKIIIPTTEDLLNTTTDLKNSVISVKKPKRKYNNKRKNAKN